MDKSMINALQLTSEFITQFELIAYVLDWMFRGICIVLGTIESSTRAKIFWSDKKSRFLVPDNISKQFLIAQGKNAKAILFNIERADL